MDYDTMEALLGCLGVLAAIAIAFLLPPALLLWLYNHVVVLVFAQWAIWPHIGYWQMFGLHWFCRMLFGSRVTTIKRNDD